jgi:hypothetical protein
MQIALRAQPTDTAQQSNVNRFTAHFTMIITPYDVSNARTDEDSIHRHDNGLLYTGDMLTGTKIDICFRFNERLIKYIVTRRTRGGAFEYFVDVPALALLYGTTPNSIEDDFRRKRLRRVCALDETSTGREWTHFVCDMVLIDTYDREISENDDDEEEEERPGFVIDPRDVAEANAKGEAIRRGVLYEVPYADPAFHLKRRILSFPNTRLSNFIITRFHGGTNPVYFMNIPALANFTNKWKSSFVDDLEREGFTMGDTHRDRNTGKKWTVVIWKVGYKTTCATPS